MDCKRERDRKYELERCKENIDRKKERLRDERRAREKIEIVTLVEKDIVRYIYM